MSLDAVRHPRVQTAMQVFEHAGAIAFLTLMGGAITAIVGYARRMPHVVEIGGKIALGGGLGLAGTIVVRLGVPKAVQILGVKEIIWVKGRGKRGDG